MDAVAVPDTVRAYGGSLGEFGLGWLNALPGTVDGLCQDWGLRREAALPGGSRSYVCRVTTTGGQSAVLKVALPEPMLSTQMATLIAARGQGYVEVLAHDLQRGALLMEALGAPLDEDSADVHNALTITAGTLARAWKVPAESVASPGGSTEHKAAGLTALIHGCVPYAPSITAPDVVTQALRYAAERLDDRDPARQVLVHGDAHLGNLLPVSGRRPGAETGYVFVDPEGFRCEPEYDLGVAVRGWNARLLAAADARTEVRSWCDLLARATGTDAQAIWQWAYLERVTSGLYLARHGLPELAVPFLTVAGRLLEA
ncbi:aminoglycoside phosphotransferase family protein [Deinococcus sp. KSM4-11]|uniref:aminoglycoside phosphotransferase family protein n=1 Tax=Deinococcus sp. KSM4-11 TaxID=2568654 RepID=UPI001454BD80|nr:aminoglycoside phosphotransferase family protein [Deinococcus sp. KSM4-11]